MITTTSLPTEFKDPIIKRKHFIVGNVHTFLVMMGKIIGERFIRQSTRGGIV